MAILAKIGNKYCDWSTICDAPLTDLMTREELALYVSDTYGSQGAQDFDQRMARVEEYGTSGHSRTTMASLLAFNRAGPNESHLATVEQFEQHYGGAATTLQEGTHVQNPEECYQGPQDSAGSARQSAPTVMEVATPRQPDAPEG